LIFFAELCRTRARAKLLGYKLTSLSHSPRTGEGTAFPLARAVRPEKYICCERMLFASHSAEIHQQPLCLLPLSLFCFLLMDLDPISDQNSPPLVSVAPIGRTSRGTFDHLRRSSQFCSAAAPQSRSRLLRLFLYFFFSLVSPGPVLIPLPTPHPIPPSRKIAAAVALSVAARIIIRRAARDFRLTSRLKGTRRRQCVRRI